MHATTTRNPLATLSFCILPAIVMTYGWAYRGTVGHEAGAMIPGAMLGVTLCLVSGRLDWIARGTVAGLAGAIGWAWGGSLSYMEHTFYTVSDSFPDVLYGYTALFFLGALWAGIGGAILGLAFTEPRSQLERLARVFFVLCAAYMLVYIYHALFPERRELVETFTVRHFHDGDWLAATIALGVSALYWLLRPKDRPAAALFFWAAVAWWLGYGLLTKLGGLYLAPLHRSESWGGVLGILIALLVYLARRQNRAALMLALYGILGGGLAFAVAVFIRHPFVVNWAPITHLPPLKQWRVGECSFGLLMGVTIALGVARLLRGGLAPAPEDAPRAPLDAAAAFAMLIALPWANFRRHFVRLEDQMDATRHGIVYGLPPEAWYIVAMSCLSLPFLVALYRYRKGDKQFAPQSAFAKALAIVLLLIAMTVAAQLLDGIPGKNALGGHMLLWVPAGLSIALLALLAVKATAEPQLNATTAPTDATWRVGNGYVVIWVATPLILLAITAASMAMQDGPLDEARKRFGPDAYWRGTARFIGVWRASYRCDSLDDQNKREGDLPLKTLEFGPYRDVTATPPNGEPVIYVHSWFLMNQYVWLRWEEDGQAEDTPLHFRNDRLYIAWPPGHEEHDYIAFEKPAAAP